ncbi:hypothetical protein ABEG18_06345 [Alsobacter sp. KACC 23698]|uniref:Uncharacterized protein n=1 Tax=Alsobacter sp. KACC 23698 TaxID=3149229 RepID=A0AAU7JJA9_9HYPH
MVADVLHERLRLRPFAQPMCQRVDAVVHPARHHVDGRLRRRAFGRHERIRQFAESQAKERNDDLRRNCIILIHGAAPTSSDHTRGKIDAKRFKLAWDSCLGCDLGWARDASTLSVILGRLQRYAQHDERPAGLPDQSDQPAQALLPCARHAHSLVVSHGMV